MSLSPCIGCGGLFPESAGPTHRYLGSSPGCWSCFTGVLARQYSDRAYYEVHRLTADAYAVQHPGRPSPQTIQSVALHLISLCAIFEQGVELEKATRIIAQAARRKERFTWLTPPSSTGAMTIADVALAEDATDHARRVTRWARSAWSAWSAHHPVVRQWLSTSWAG